MNGSYDAALYIHIPFCSRKCDYCDFYSITDYSCSADAVRQIGRQIESDKNAYGIRFFNTVYIGGGTPGSLAPELLASLLDRIREVHKDSLPSEVTLECNPENINDNSIKIWKDAGVNRISLGVQTFQDRFLGRAGRNSSRSSILKAIDSLKKFEGISLSLDLIQGLPGMNREDQLADLKEALEFGPDHISWYTLTLEEGTPLADEWNKRQSVSLKPEESERIWLEGCRMLEEAGYGRYEVSNFARPGKSSLHNRAYWEMRPYLGCGPGAVSMILNEKGEVERHRIRPDVVSYAEGEIILVDREIIGGRDFIKDFLLMGLRIIEGINLKAFRDLFGCGPERFFPDTMDRFCREGLLSLDENCLKTTSRGMDLLNTLLIDLFDELDRREPPAALNWPLSRAGFY